MIVHTSTVLLVVPWLAYLALGRGTVTVEPGRLVIRHPRVLRRDLVVPRDGWRAIIVDDGAATGRALCHERTAARDAGIAAAGARAALAAARPVHRRAAYVNDMVKRRAEAAEAARAEVRSRGLSPRDEATALAAIDANLGVRRRPFP